jgi:hypothetical protein
MNTAAATPLDSLPSAEARHHRRSREEVEALAKNFIAAPASPAAANPSRTRLAFAAGGIALAALLAVTSWPDSAKETPRPVAEKSPAAVEAEQWRARLDADRERKRRELQAGADYLAKMAAGEAALLQEMGARASRLTAVPEASPEPAAARQAPGNAEPTPREAPAPRRPVQAASAAPAASAPAQAPATTPAVPTAKAETPAPATTVAAVQCKLHVSQLSSSGTLTFEGVKAMKGARVDGSGNVLTPPVTLEDGRRVTFQVAPDGCMKWRRA